MRISTNMLVKDTGRPNDKDELNCKGRVELMIRTLVMYDGRNDNCGHRGKGYRQTWW